MKRPILIALGAFGASTLALLAYGFVASDRFASLPDPASIRESFAKADSVALRVTGPATPKPAGFFLKDRASLERLSRLLVFEGRASRATGARFSTNDTDAIQARIVRGGQPAEVVTILGGRLLYGPDGKYTVHLKDDQFDRAVRSLAEAEPPSS